MTPATMVAALRRMSGQLAMIMPSLILPPIRPFNSFGGIGWIEDIEPLGGQIADAGNELEAQ